ncbi:MAG: hypothetical protein ACRDTG_02830 [Pseudonocardiaceae bacterium]
MVFGVQVKVVNRRAMARYAGFWKALLLVGEAVADARKVAVRVRDDSGGGMGKRWQVASGEEIVKSCKRADQSLGALCKAAQRWEAELISRDWRV